MILPLLPINTFNNMNGTLHIEIDGITYPVKVTLGAMLLFKEETGIEADKMNGLTHSLKWLWCCTKSASSRSENPLKMSCQEFLDCLTPEILEKWAEVMNQTTDQAKKKTPKLTQKGSMSS